MKIRHYIADDINILSLQFREDVRPDYGTEIAPGITLHFAGNPDEGEIIPIFLEIEQTRSRPLNHVELERLNEHGERLDEPDVAEILSLWLTLPPKVRSSIGEKMREAGKAAAPK
ncbi:MAG: hypothetical protein M3494_06340 [Actinomycetota bacterium]|nr:hypothetical protein [Rubrobacter sp.]MDQ3507617.1 hypothetical protein [Actinomycetota bacterium]